MTENLWLFNTDETEAEGEGAYRHMLDLSRMAAWGRCRGTGARRTLNRPIEGETVFFYLSGQGIIASGEVRGQAYKADDIFGARGEYHRDVINLRVLPRPLTVAEVKEVSGYQLPYRQTVCRLPNANAVQFLQEHFERVPVA